MADCGASFTCIQLEDAIHLPMSGQLVRTAGLEGLKQPIPLTKLVKLCHKNQKIVIPYTYRTFSQKCVANYARDVPRQATRRHPAADHEHSLAPSVLPVAGLLRHHSHGNTHGKKVHFITNAGKKTTQDKN